MRGDEDAEWRHFSEDHLELEEGDNQANFVRSELGHRPHHLFLWHLSDVMGVLSRVLNVISPEVAANCENVALDVQQVQRSSTKRRRDADKEEKKRSAMKQKHKEAFRIGLVASLTSISMSQVSDRIMKEEDNVRKFKFQLIKAEDLPTATLLNQIIDECTEKVGKLEQELQLMREGTDKIMDGLSEEQEDE